MIGLMATRTHPNRRARFSPIRIAMAVAALLIITLAWWNVLGATRGLISRELTGAGGEPLRFIVAEGAADAPGVVVAHGFSGSRQLMLGYAHVLARAGYGVVLLDFDGHGAASGKLDREGASLQRNLNAAYAALRAQPEVDSARIALLGHSMGSGAVMSAAIANPERYAATVAVSPTGAAVSPAAPRNLLLMAGSLEPNFVANAKDLLARAGGVNDDLAGGRGRDMLVIPNVEHITILFSPGSHQAALDWLNRVFALPPAAAARDSRILWYGAHVAAWLLLLTAVAPLFPAALPLPGGARRRPWSWLSLPLGALAATGVLFLLGRLGDFSTLGGLLVGGTLAVWFAVFGLVWLRGFYVPRPSGKDLLWGLGLFAALTLAFGVMADRVWLPWWLILPRLARWPFVALAALPWLLTAGLAQHRAPAWRRAGWWLAQTVVIVAGLGLAVAANPGLFFIVLLMPVIPIILAIVAVAGAAVDRPWSYAIGGALFFGWLLVAVFPLA